MKTHDDTANSAVKTTAGAVETKEAKLEAEMSANKKERAGKPLSFPADWLDAILKIDNNERGYIFETALLGWYEYGVPEEDFKKYLADTEKVIRKALKHRGLLAADRESNLVEMRNFPTYEV